MRLLLLALLTVLGLLAGCGPADPAPAPAGSGTSGAGSGPASGDGTRSDQQFPDIVSAVATRTSEGGYDFEVTVSSPYDTPDRYADGWRIVGPDGAVYAEHGLTHDHAGEQPFTRTQSGVEIPAGVSVVTVEGRDQANGYGGRTVEVELPVA